MGACGSKAPSDDQVGQDDIPASNFPSSLVKPHIKDLEPPQGTKIKAPACDVLKYDIFVSADLLEGRDLSELPCPPATSHCALWPSSPCPASPAVSLKDSAIGDWMRTAHVSSKSSPTSFCLLLIDAAKTNEAATSSSPEVIDPRVVHAMRLLLLSPEASPALMAVVLLMQQKQVAADNRIALHADGVSRGDRGQQSSTITMDLDLTGFGIGETQGLGWMGDEAQGLGWMGDETQGLGWMGDETQGLGRGENQRGPKGALGECRERPQGVEGH